MKKVSLIHSGALDDTEVIKYGSSPGELREMFLIPV
jgi:hypothetical protein